MKRFLAIYTGSPDGLERWNALPEQDRNARQERGMDAWKKWREDHASDILDEGAPLGRTKRVTKSGIADIHNAMAAYVVVRAESHHAAAKMFVAHPHFAIFAGDGVEIMECLTMPGGPSTT
jgi:hypothetical protein